VRWRSSNTRFKSQKLVRRNCLFCARCFVSGGLIVLGRLNGRLKI